MERIEIIARGVLLGPRGVLLCRQVGGDYTFLPGGHVEFNEPAPAALTRELREELGMPAKAENFFGTIEHIFAQDGQTHHEINLVFEMIGPAITRRARFTSNEPHIEFLWQPLHALADANLLPKALRTLIPQWTRGKNVPWWSDSSR